MTSTRWQVGALIFLLGAVYLNALGGGFHYDDFHSIVNNPHIREWANTIRFFVDPDTFSGDSDKAMYRPILLLSYALNYTLGGYEPFGYLLINVLIHLGASLLVWRVGLQAGLSASSALAAGVLFAAHPLASEPVNYISSRSESLAGLFYLAAFLLLGRDTRLGLWAGLVCYILGLLTKSVVITLPVVLLLYEYYKCELRAEVINL
jgi:4-amino-4-deoxy-L-arabinose transferase-like glycosyltransferase